MSMRIWLLFIAHVVAGIVFSVWYAVEGRVPFVVEYILIVPPCALAFCQSCLLAFWATMSHAAVWKRLTGLIGGTVYLEILIVAAIEDELIFMATMATGGVVVVLWVIRLRKAQLFRFLDQPQPGNAEGLQFSIRGLMLFTFAVAVVINFAKGLREVDERLPMLFLVTIWALCFVVTNLAALWAALGIGSPVPRNVAVILMSLALGWFVSYAFAQPWDTRFYIISMMFLQSLCLIGSLLVIRSCGYRLVGHRAMSS